LASIVRYMIRRLLFMIPVFLGVAILTFLIGNAAGNPINLIRLGLRNPNPAVLDALRRYYHLDVPVYERFVFWLWDLMHGNLGVSISGRPVASQIWSWAWTTMELQIISLFLAIVIGIPIGIYSAKNQYSKADYVITSIAVFGFSMPTFWLGIILIIIFSYDLGWLPSSGATGISFVWWGTSGLSDRRVTYRYALRNAISPIVTIIGLGFGASLAGAPATETTFSWPGLGYAFTQAASNLDIPLVQGITIVITIMVLIANLVTDIVYATLDPRVRID